jgi:hypothetical protein
MIARMIRHASAYGLAGVIAVLAAPGLSRAATAFTVAAGWDLFQTDPAQTTFPGLGNLMGVPLGNFNFAGNQNGNIPLPGNPGNVNVNPTDTILERTAAAVASPQAGGGTATVPLVMVGLQLETTAPVNFGGAGLDNYFVTLQSTRGGSNSIGSISLTWNANGLSGTFSSAIDVFFDIRKGSLAGPIITSMDAVLTSSGTTWSDIPPPGSLLIVGANRFLSGISGDPTQDFWPTGIPDPNNPLPGVMEAKPAIGAVHTAFDTTITTTIPEPASIVMLSLGLVGTGSVVWRRWNQSA